MQLRPGLFLLIAACGPSGYVPPSEPEAPPLVPTAYSDGLPADTSAAPAASAAPTAPAPAPAPGGYRLAWDVKDPTGWNHALAIAPSGDILALSAFDLSVFARHDGRLLDSIRVCDDIALRFESLAVRPDGKILVVCSESIMEVTLPEMSKRRLVALPWTDLDERAESCAVSAERVAVGNRKGRIVELDARTWKQVALHQQPAGAEIEGMAYSPDGKRLAFSFDGDTEEGLMVVQPGGKLERVPNVKTSTHAVAFSPDGLEVFAELRSFTAARLAVPRGTITREYEVGSWTNAARFVGPGAVVATGSDGVTIFANEILRLDDDTGEGLAITDDHGVICAGGRGGEIRCWASRPIPASTYQRPPSSGTNARGTTAVGPAAAAIEGQLLAAKGKTLVLDLPSSAALTVGTKATLTKKVDQQLGGMAFTAWLGIARVTVTKIEGSKVTVTIDEELSKMQVNGKQLDHFTAGSTVRLDRE
jgi:WD40 repeat protein